MLRKEVKGIIRENKYLEDSLTVKRCTGRRRIARSPCNMTADKLSGLMRVRRGVVSAGYSQRRICNACVQAVSLCAVYCNDKDEQSTSPLVAAWNQIAHTQRRRDYEEKSFESSRVLDVI